MKSEQKGFETWGIYDKNDDLEACEANFKSILEIGMELYKRNAE